MNLLLWKATVGHAPFLEHPLSIYNLFSISCNHQGMETNLGWSVPYNVLAFLLFVIVYGVLIDGLGPWIMMSIVLPLMWLL